MEKRIAALGDEHESAIQADDCVFLHSGIGGAARFLQLSHHFLLLAPSLGYSAQALPSTLSLTFVSCKENACDFMYSFCFLTHIAIL